MRRLRVLIAAVLILAAVGSLVACGENKPVGTWVISSETIAGISVSAGYTFNEDGTGIMSVTGVEMGMTYEVEGDEMTIHYKIGNVSVNKTLRYHVDGDTLTLNDGDVETKLTRKK